MVRAEPTGPMLKGITYIVRPTVRTQIKNNTLMQLFLADVANKLQI